MSTSPTVVMYSPDTIGLGHIKRHSSIAAELVAQASETNVVMLVGTASGNFFEWPAGVDSIKIPSVQKTGKDTWRARSLDLSTETTQRIRSGLIRETLDSLTPDVFLVDHLPAGIWRELIPVLKFLKERSPHTKIVLGLRDILDDELEVRRRWSSDGTYQLIKEFYDSVFIYGDQTIFPSAQRYGIHDAVCQDVNYLGYIGSRGSLTPGPHPSGESLGLTRRPDAKLMLVTAGGGYDAYPMMSSILSGLAEMAATDRPDCVLISGPLMPAEHRNKLVDQAKCVGATVIPFTTNMKGFLGAADIIATMGGYNSMVETMVTGKPTINIPRPGPSQEQTIRAELFDELGLLKHVPLASATPERVSTVVADAMRSGVRNTVDHLPLNGAQLAARKLISMFRRHRASVRHEVPHPVLHSPGEQPYVAA